MEGESCNELTAKDPGFHDFHMFKLVSMFENGGLSFKLISKEYP